MRAIAVVARVEYTEDMNKICARCSRKFSSTHYYQRFCSRKCFGASLKGIPLTPEHRQKVSNSKRDAHNGAWKGDQVGLSALHHWVRKRKPKPDLCEICQQVPPRELSSNDHSYTRNLCDWQWLCKRCHMTKDNHLEKLVRARLAHSLNRKPFIHCYICGKRSNAHSLCSKHYERWKKHGRPDAVANSKGVLFEATD